MGKRIHLTPEQIKRFHTKYVKSPNGCWEWQHQFHSKGYGRFYIRGGREKLRAHRISYFLSKGEIPDGFLICHACDNRKCVNPDHLWLGTNRDNIADMMAKKAKKKNKNALNV